MELSAKKEGGFISWQLATHLVTFKDNEVVSESYTSDPTYWKGFYDMHKESGFRIVSIAPVEWSEEQHQRLAHIQGFPEGWLDVYRDYVIDGVLDGVSSMPIDSEMRLLANELTQQNNSNQIIDLAINTMGGM